MDSLDFLLSCFLISQSLENLCYMLSVQVAQLSSQSLAALHSP
jgi:hypothetical protein